MTDLNKKEEKFRDILQSSREDIDSAQLWQAIRGNLPGKRNRLPWVWFFSGIVAGMLILYLLLPVVSPEKDNYKESATITEETSSVFGNLNDKVNTHKPFSSGAWSPEKGPGQTIRKSSTGQSEQGSVPGFPLGAALPFASGQFELRVKQGLMSFYANQSRTGDDRSAVRNPFMVYNAIAGDEDMAKDKRVSSLEYLPASIKGMRVKESPVPVLNNASGTIQINARQRSLQLGYAFRSGINMNSSTYKAVSGEMIGVGDGARKEFARPGTMTDVRLNINHASGWGFVTGLSYMTEAVALRDQSFSFSTENFISETATIDQEGYTQSGPVISERTTIREYNRQIHRVHKGLDLLAGISAPILNTRSFTLRSEMLANYRIAGWNRGYYLNNNNETISMFAAGETNPYRTQAIWSGQLALLWQFKGPGYRIGLSPYYRFRTAGLLNKNTGLDLRQNNYGLQISLDWGRH